MRLIDADELLERMYRYNDNEGARMPYGDDDSLIHKDSACFLIENAPTIEPEQTDCEYKISKIADLVEGTIDHFGLDDAMDLLYQIKGIIKNG